MGYGQESPLAWGSLLRRSGGAHPRFVEKVNTVNRSQTSRDQQSSPLALFYSYAHADEELKVFLDKHLASLKKEGVIDSWHDRMIDAGDQWETAIRDRDLNSAQVILLLVSADFLASRYCYDIEMTDALKRHERGDACVIPVILRSCDWHNTPFARLQALPKDGLAVNSWRDRDEAFTDIARGIRRSVTRLRRRSESTTTANDAIGAESPIGIAATMVETDTARIELTIDRDYNTYSENDKRHLIEAILNLLETDSDVRVVRKRRGSVKLTLELTHAESEKLLWAIRQGLLQAHGVIDASILHEVKSGSKSPALEDRLELSTAEIGLSVRTVNCLEERGVFTVRDLLHCTKDDLLGIANFGEKTLEEVFKALEEIGFCRPPK